MTVKNPTTRRAFLRAIVATVVAVVAGVPLARAWASAMEKHRRREMIVAQLQYQMSRAMEARGRELADQLYGDCPQNFAADLEYSTVHRIHPFVRHRMTWKAGNYA